MQWPKKNLLIFYLSSLNLFTNVNYVPVTWYSNRDILNKLRDNFKRAQLMQLIADNCRRIYVFTAVITETSPFYSILRNTYA